MNWVIVVTNFDGSIQWVQDVIGPFDTQEEAAKYPVHNSSEFDMTLDYVSLSPPR